MPGSRFIFILLAGCFLLTACNTLYNSKTVSYEIVVPGEAKIPNDYRKIVLKYNNCNVGYNAKFSKYVEDNEIIEDPKNTDSIASEIYYQSFAGFIKNQNLYDTVIELNKEYNNQIILDDSLIYDKFKQEENSDSTLSENVNMETIRFLLLVKKFNPDSINGLAKQQLDPDFGLFTKDQIEEIATETGADLLLSFDFFESVDGIYTPAARKLSEAPAGDIQFLNPDYSLEEVFVISSWNVYDLRKNKFVQSFQKLDTIKWYDESIDLKAAKKILPPRYDAVMNAAEIAGSHLAEFVAPHWIQVTRMYYQSHHFELKQTDKMVQENRWFDAAAIWKKNIANKNESIAAKSMFNLAVACELNGDIDAALDWVIKSFHKLQNKNQVHQDNCNNYIKILAQRRLDIKRLTGED